MANRKYEYPIASLHAYRNKFDVSHSVKGSFKHGRLIPFDVMEILPGDTISCDLASIIRMSTPIAPIMDNIHMQYDAWFVPNRLVDDHFEQIMGANKDGAWLTDEGTYLVPKVPCGSANYSISPMTIGDFMGLPIDGTSRNLVSAYPGRGYSLIWNENYRSQVVSAPLPIDHSSSGRVLVSDITTADRPTITGGGSDLSAIYFYAGQPLPLGKYSDYFTKALPQPIKHDPIPFIPEDLAVGANFGEDDVMADNDGNVQILGNSHGFRKATALNDSGANLNVVASVNASWNTIEAIRVAFQVDKFYWKDGAYGSRYWEILEGHFKVTNKSGVLQLPQKLGQMKFRINVDQVLSTAGYSADDSTTVGAPGANSVTTCKGSLFTSSFTEHGYLYILGGTRHDHTYGQGFQKHWTRTDRLDFYDPVFANIGEQPVYLKELYARDFNDTIFGYQEAWAEYRFIPDRVCGLLNPSAANSLDFWTLADKFDAAPMLNEEFIYENRNSIARALVTGVNGPDFIFDTYIKMTAVREMPLFSVPGLVDHH